MEFLKEASRGIGVTLSLPIALGRGAVSYVYHRFDGKDHDAASKTSGKLVDSIFDDAMEIAGEVGPPILNTIISIGVSALLGQNNTNHKQSS